MMRHILIWALILFAFIGIADSWYLTEHALTETPLTCDIEGLGDCNVVAASSYSKLFGLPLALYGVGFYTMLFVFAALTFLSATRAVFLSILVFGTIGFLASVYFMFLQIAVIKAICVYCLLSAILSLLSFIGSFALWKYFAPPKTLVVP